MKRASRFFLGLTFFAIVAIAWVIVIGAESDVQRQDELIRQAEIYLEDEIFILALPLLEEAIGFNTERTFEAEGMLKDVYLQLIDQRGMRRNYIELLNRQMSRSDAPIEVFIEAAEFHLENNRIRDALNVLTNGISRTDSEKLVAMYESERYAFRLGFQVYNDVTAFHEGTIGVREGDSWGILRSDGSVLIPTEYDRVSTFSNDRAIVQRGEDIFAVNRTNNRIALLGEDVSDFGNFANNRITLLIDGRWYRATGSFELGSATFDWIGMHSNGNAAALLDGRWGVVDTNANWVIPAEYDGIIMDELGRAYAQGAVFIKQGNVVFLLVDGEQVAGPFEDARPFGNEGYAAVKNNGLWGFIDTSGEVRIDFQFDDALSFGQHLAAVRVGDYWGYVSLFGVLVIEAVFLEAKSFDNGSAPVLTERGWRFITLHEFMEGPGGL